MTTASNTNDDLENCIYHVAGHTLFAMCFEFPVELLSLDGFSQTDQSRLSERVQRLDEYTMIRVPEMHSPVGTFPHTRMMENLCRVALGGPVLQHLHQRGGCTVSDVREHESDWHQAWTAAGFLYKSERDRMVFMEREVSRAQRFATLPGMNDYIYPMTEHLRAHRAMEGSQLQELWDRVKAEDEARQMRPISRSLLEMNSDETHEEWVDTSVRLDDEEDWGDDYYAE